MSSSSSHISGTLPTGCISCLKGHKVVLFVTGKCNDMCFYCPISFNRWAKDAAYVNERPLKSLRDIFTEVDRMDAKGAGITGGDPFLVLPKVLRYIKALKKRHGRAFHIHLYTSGRLATPENLKALYEAGLDEIRFHWAEKQLVWARQFDWTVGAEIPMLPGKVFYDKTVKYLHFLENAGASFCNLNELEFAERNEAIFSKLKYSLKNGIGYAVRGSESNALKLVNYARKHLKLTVHYCPAYVKDGIQMRNRFRRTAANIKRPFESVDEEGLIVKGVIYSDNLARLSALFREKNVPRDLYALNEKAGRLETSPAIAIKFSRRRGLSAFVVKEHPTATALEIERIPLKVEYAGFTF